MKENQPSAIDQLTAKKDLYGVLIQKRETRVDVAQEMLKTKTFYPVALPSKGQTITNDDVQRVIVHGEKNKKRHERVGLHLERVKVSIVSLREKQEIIDKKIVGYHRAVSHLSELKEADSQYEQIKELYDKGYLKKTVYERVAGHVKQLCVLPSQDEELASWVDVINNETEKAKNQEPTVQTAVKNENEDAAFQVTSKKETSELTLEIKQMFVNFIEHPEFNIPLEKKTTLGQFLQKNNLKKLAEVISVSFEKEDIIQLYKMRELFIQLVKDKDEAMDSQEDKDPVFNSPNTTMQNILLTQVFYLQSRMQKYGRSLSDAEKKAIEDDHVRPKSIDIPNFFDRLRSKGAMISGTMVDYSGDHKRHADQ